VAALAEFKLVSLRTKDWKAQHDALASTRTKLADAKARDLALRQQLTRLERIRRVRPLLLALDTARARREAWFAAGDIPLLDENAADVFRLATQEIAVADAQILRLQRDIDEARAALQETVVDRSILSLEADITELNERRLQFRAHRTDIVKRTEEIRLEWVRVQELAAGLGWPSDSEEAVRQRVPAASARARLTALIKDRTALEQALKTHRANLADRQEGLRQAEDVLSRLVAGAIDPELAVAVEQAMKLGDHEAVMADLQLEIDDLAVRIEAGLAALGSWRRPVESLQAIVVPEALHVQRLIEQHRADAAEEKLQRDALALKTRELAQLELELQQFVRNFQPVSRDQVAEARRLRDASWQTIKNAPQALMDRAPVFEGQIVEADRLADDRLDRAQYEADRQARSDALEHKQRERAELEHRLQALKARSAERTAQWDALSSACGLPQLPLEMALVWLQQRQLVLDLAETPAPELGVCLRRAREQITLADQAQGQRTTLEQQIREGRLSLARSQAALETAQQGWDAWGQSWQQAVQSIGYGADTAVAQVEAEIGAMQDVDRLLDRIRGIRSERIETMQADLDGLAVTARHLAAQVAPDLAEHSPDDQILELVRRLNLAKQAEATFARLQASLARSEAELAATEQGLQAVHARLRPMMVAAGVDEVAALSVAIERSDQRRDIERKSGSAEQDLAEAADGLSLDALRAESEAIAPDQLKAELDRLEVAAGEVVEEIATLSNAYGTQKNAFDALDGADQAARAEAQRQEALAAMADAAEHYLRLKTAARLLTWSIEKFRETQQGPMLAKASSIFNGVTMDSFSRLLVDSDAATPRLFGIRPNGEQVDVAGMSEGSRDQLYLALRLAALELQVEQGFGMPLIADDLFINFDDRRTMAGLKMLGELSRSMQVVFLTHHDHLVPLAQEALGADLNVVQL
jgi:uncharacterized protein YhaN